MRFLYGSENFLISQEIKKIKEINSTNNIVYIDEEDSIEKILSEIFNVSLFENKKILIIRNHPIFSNDKLSKIITENLKNISKLIIDIIFVLDEENYLKNDLTKFLEKNATLVQFKKIETSQIPSVIKEIVTNKNGYISNSAVIKLANKLPNDLNIIVNEIEKILLYSNDITDEVVENIVGEYLKDDFFALTNALSNDDVPSIIMAYHERKKQGDEITLMIGQISNLLNLCVFVFSFEQQGLTHREISDKTKIHIFRVKKAFELIYSSSIEKIKFLINELAVLDLKIKSGEIDAEIGMNKFILEIIKKSR